jgi:hypothetical protein
MISRIHRQRDRHNETPPSLEELCCKYSIAESERKITYNGMSGTERNELKKENGYMEEGADR